MKKILFCLIGIAMLASCGHKADREAMIRDIEARELGMSNEMLGSGDTTEFNPEEMLALYRKFAHTFPDDSLAPVYMQRAADMCISLDRSDEAIALLDSIISLYPGFEDMAGCYFLKGYAYDVADNYDAAREAYTYFVENYPDHYLANDVRITIKFLGLSAEEMLDAIMAGATDENLAQE